MRTDERLDEAISGWLELSAPARLPDRVLEGTFERTRRSRQQIGWRVIVRGAGVTRSVAMLGAASIVVAVAAMALNVYSNQPAVGGPLPSDDPRNPFLGTWHSTSDADGGTQTMIVRTAADGRVEIVVTDDVASVCKGTPSTMSGNGSVDGNKLVIPAPLYTCDDGSEPRTLSGPPLVEVLRDLTYVRDAEADVLTVGPAAESVWTRRAAAATTGPSPSPSGAAPSTGPSSSPSAGALVDFSLGNATPTFESPINGYSFKYIDRGGLVPATERWDPATRPLSGLDMMNRAQFDEVETGFGAQFFSASTEIPDGASIDEWVDASVVKYLSGDCHAPRSQQAEIIIDGQSGWISECVDEVVATVVVDGRLYLFILYHDRPDARAFFDAFAATIELTPETAATPGSVSGVGASSPSVLP